MINCYYIIVSVTLLHILHNVEAAFKPEDIRNHLGTKTPYRFKYNKNDSKIKFPGKIDISLCNFEIFI